MRTDVLFEGQELLDLIPHRDPFVMVDKLYHYEEGKVISGFFISPDHFFVDQQLFTEYGMIENIAQTAGLYVGMYRRERDIEVDVGFIGSIGKFKLFERPHSNSEIETQVEVLNVVMGVIIVKGKIFQDETICAECEMKVFPPANTK